MSRSAGPLRTLLLVLAAAVIGLMLGLGAVSVAAAIDTGQASDLGDPVRFDPTRVTVTPAPGPTPSATPTANPTATRNPQPLQVVPGQPSPADDDDNDDADDTDG